MQNTPLAISYNKIIKAAFLIAGTCIGGGMLALPISSSSVGFIPSISVMILSCIFMTITGLLYLEATLWMKDQAHINTLSTNLLNKFWRVVCWIVYLFICYASLVAYISGGGKEISFVISEIFNFEFSDASGFITFTIIFGIILFLGHQSVERTNSVLFISMIFAYILLILISGSKINFNLLGRQEWNSQLLFVFPLMLTTFSFPGLVPTIVPDLDKNPRAVRLSILIGTILTFVVYFLWLLLVFGSVPHEGKYGLKDAFLCDIPATECLHYALKNPFISGVAQFFAFFALATSFLGISLSLFDFLRDSFDFKAHPIIKKISYCMLILIPSWFFAIRFERAFIAALELSGGIGDAILSGIIPALMVWNGRYHYKKSGEYRVMGGKPMLIGVICFALVILFCEIFRRVFI